MKQLVRLEMKKLNRRSIWMMGGATSGVLLIYLLFSVVVCGIPMPLEAFLCKLIAYNAFAYTIFIAVLLHSMFSEEIAARSFSILFTYPIPRMKLLWSKVILTALIGLPFMIMSSLLQFIILWPLYQILGLVQGQLEMTLFIRFLATVIIRSLLATLTAFIPLAVDVRYASAQCTLLSAGILSLFLYTTQENALLGGYLWLLIIAAVAGLLIIRESLGYIAQKDMI